MRDIKQNSIHTIGVYKYNGFWVFDDQEAGLDKEAFVAGADVLCDHLSGGKDAFTAVFSKINFPGHKLYLLIWSPESNGEQGTYYKVMTPGFNNLQIWLCPALLKYFDTPPERIYIDYKN